MTNLHVVLDSIAPNINAMLKACAWLLWLNLRVMELQPGTSAQPRPPSQEVSMPMQSQKASTPPQYPAKKCAPVAILLVLPLP